MKRTSAAFAGGGLLLLGCNALLDWGTGYEPRPASSDAGVDATRPADATMGVPDAPADQSALGDAGVDAPFDAAPLGPVTGTFSNVYLSDNGPSLTPFYDPAVVLNAYAPSADGGSLEKYPGVFNTDGTFTIADVPNGPYWLEWTQTLYGSVVPNACQCEKQTVLFNTSERTFALANTIFGANRPSAYNPDGGVVPSLNLTLDGMSPWSSSDQLVLYSTNSGAFVPGLQYEALSPPLAIGETSYTGSAPYYSNVIDSSQGDQTGIVQLVARDAGIPGSSLVSLDRSALIGGVSIPVGGTGTFNSSLEPLPLGSTAVQWDHSAFQAHVADINPNEVPVDEGVFIGVGPGEGFLSFALLEYSEPTQASVQTVSLPFGNPFNPAWEVTLGASLSVQVPITQVDGSTMTAVAQGSISCGWAFTSLPSSPLAPTVSPVTSPTINGKDAFATLNTGVTTTPVFAWSPPALGAPTRYEIEIYDEDGYDTFYMFAAASPLPIPDGFLKSGHTYYAVVDAIDGPAQPAPQNPIEGAFAGPLPECDAQAVLGAFAP